MVGTPQLPLKYRRKAGPVPIHVSNSGFRDCAQKLAMARLCTSDNLPFDSDDTIPTSPTSSYMSPVSSSPTRHMYTPDPPSSPFTEPYVLSSPRSSFDFPHGRSQIPYYDSRPSKTLHDQDIKPDHSSWLSHRRSSSLTAPTLVSDVEPSEYSDVDPSTLSDDAPEPTLIRTAGRAALKIGDLLGHEDQDLLNPYRIKSDVQPRKFKHTTWEGEIDVASALLDLSRQVRVCPTLAHSTSTSPTEAKPCTEGASMKTDEVASEGIGLSRNDDSVHCVTGGVDSANVTLDHISSKKTRENDELAVPRMNASAHDIHSSTSTTVDVTPPPTISQSEAFPSSIHTAISSLSPIQDMTPEMDAVKRGDGVDNAATASDTRRDVPADTEDAMPKSENEDNVSDDNNKNTSTDATCDSSTYANEIVNAVLPSDTDSDVSSTLTALSSPSPPLDCSVRSSPLSDDEGCKLETELIRLQPTVSPESSHVTPTCAHDTLYADRENDSPDVPVGKTGEVNLGGDDEECCSLVASVDTRASHTREDSSPVQSLSWVPNSTSISHDTPTDEPVHLKTPPVLATDYEDVFIPSVLSSPLTAVSSLPEYDTDMDGGPSYTWAQNTTAGSSSRANQAVRDKTAEDLATKKPTMRGSRIKESRKANSKAKGNQEAKAEKENRGLHGTTVQRKAKGKGKAEPARVSSVASAATDDSGLESEDGMEIDERTVCKTNAVLSCGVKITKKDAPRKRRKNEIDNEPVSTSKRVPSGSNSGKARHSEKRKDDFSSDKEVDEVPIPKKRRRKQPGNGVGEPDSTTVSEHASSDPPRQDGSMRSNPELRGLLIQTMALSRASSMPASTLLRELCRAQPQMVNERSKDEWIEEIEAVLSGSDVFGRVQRDGLDAADKPLETLYFYIPENDEDQDRATLLREMMPKKRNETKKHKQYYYRPLGKLSRWDMEDDL